MKNNTKVYKQKLKIKPENIAELEELQKGREAKDAASLILQCLHKEDSLKQASLLKKIGAAINELARSDENSTSLHTCLHVLSQLFTVVDYKNPTRRALISIFHSLPISVHHIATSCLKTSVYLRLEDAANNIETPDHKLRHPTDMISSLLENFKLGTQIINQSGLQVLRYLVTYLSHMVKEASSLENPVDKTVMMTDCLAATKTIIAVLQKTCRQPNDAVSVWSDTLVAIGTELVTILNNDFLPDCKTASGMALCLIVVLSYNKKPPGQLLMETLFPHHQLIGDSGGSRQQESISKVLSEKRWQGPVSFEHLCVCHGVLTMVPIQELIQPLDTSKDKDGYTSTLLFDILFSDICLLCECMKESFDSLSAFKSLSLWTEKARNAVLLDSAQSWLRSQVLGSASIPQKLLSFVWNHWEHPVEVIRYQTKAIFEHVVAMHIGVSSIEPSKDFFLKDLTGKLIKVGWHSRGIYGPLCCLIPVTGAKGLLQWYPCIPKQVLNVLKDKITAPHAIDFIVAISKTHHQEILNAKENMDTWHQTWTVPILDLLEHQESAQDILHIKQTLSNLLRYHPDSLQFIVSHLQRHDKKNIEVLVTCLKTARGLGLIKVKEDEAVLEERTWAGVVSIHWLQSALCSVSDQVRLDALGLLCDSPRTTEPISVTDISLLKLFLPVNMNSQSPSFRQECTTHLKKLLMRMSEGLRISIKKLARNNNDKTLSNRIERYKEFLHWFANLLFSSLFPEASFARRTTALHLLKLLSFVFTSNQQGTNQEPFVFCDVMTTPNVTVLLECLHDTYVVNKVLAYELLTSCHSNVLPFQTLDALCPWLHRIHNLLSSPRAVDASTTCVILKLLIDKCLLPLYPIEQACNNEETTNSTYIKSQLFRVLCFLLDSLKAQRTVAERSLNQAASQAPMHGVVYCIREILGHHPVSQFSGDSSWRQLVSSVLDECFHVTKLVSPVVTSSSPEGHMIDDDYDDDEGGSREQVFNPSSQILLVCCWRTMKEVALLLGDLAQSAPLVTSHDCMTSPGSHQLNKDQSPSEEVHNDVKDQTPSDVTNAVFSRDAFPASPSTSHSALADTAQSEGLQNDVKAGPQTSFPLISNITRGLLTSSQIRRIGEFFTTVLLTSKHHGAFELAYNGFVKLCNTLWTCENAELRALPLQWLDALLADIAGCVPSDVLCGTRRSAGVPFFVQAIVTTEPSVAGRASFKRLMNDLLAVANQTIDSNLVAKDSTLPQVHARNILRALFRDTRLGEDVFPFVASGLKVAISGFLSDSWAVRNSSTLLFSALMTRIFGVKKSKDEHSRRNCMTGREFFIRFPELHSFLVDQLKQATETMECSSSVDLHPGLYPVLVLLSRLYPSTMDGADSTLNMAPFVPYVIRCGSSCVLKTRTIAARAMVPLVTGETMVETVKQLLTSLPTSVSPANQNKVHGTLLQIQHLIKDHLVQSTATDLVKRMVTHEVIPMLAPVLWISTKSNPCDITRAVFLEILLDLTLYGHIEVKVIVENEGQAVDASLFLRKTIIEIALKETSTNEPSFLVPIGRSYLKEVCARILLAAAKNAVDNESDKADSPQSTTAEYDGNDKTPILFIPISLCEVVCTLLMSRDYEVRLCVLEHLSANLPRCNVSVWPLESFPGTEGYDKLIKCERGDDFVRIYATLLEMAIQTEQHLDCLAKVYQILSESYSSFIKFPHTFSSGKTISVVECWQILLQRASDSSHQRDGIMCSLLGLLRYMACFHLCPMFVENRETRPSQGYLRDCFQDYLALMKFCCQDDKSYALRLKAAKSICLIRDFLNFLGHYPLEFWKVFVTLLNDDDAFIRDTAALRFSGPQRSISTPAMEVQGIFSSVFWSFYREHPNATLNWILEWIVNQDSPRAAVTQPEACPSDQQSDIDLLFERNSLNSYHERVMLALEAAKCLKEIANKALYTEEVHDVISTRDDIISRFENSSAGNDVTFICKDICDYDSYDNNYDNRASSIFKPNKIDCKFPGDLKSLHATVTGTRRKIMRSPHNFIDHESDVIKDLSRKCVDRLQNYLQASELHVTKHFYDIFSNILGLVVDGFIRLSNQNWRNAQLDPTLMQLQSKLTICGEDSSTELGQISGIVVSLISDAKMRSFLCHPVMKDAVKDLCRLYGIDFQD